MHQLIAAPFLDDHLVVRPGHKGGFRIGSARYQDLITARDHGARVPPWLAVAAAQTWGMQLTGRLAPQVLVRNRSTFPYVNASWEINLGCNYDCEHCYLGPKAFAGLTWDDKTRLLTTIRDAGVLFLQITGGEPLLDRDFPAAYQLAARLGLMVGIQTNGYLLSRPRVLDVLAATPPFKVAISVYGATDETYDGLTRTRGAFQRFLAGLAAAREAQLPVNLNIVAAERNEHEIDAMKALADRFGFPCQVFGQMSPTFYGDGLPIPAQAPSYAARSRTPFGGCNAGYTFFHADPHGLVSFCKIGRDDQVNLVTEGLDALRALPGIADAAHLRTGGCSGCALSGTCSTCRPLAKLYQEAKAPRGLYCQHPDPT